MDIGADFTTAVARAGRRWRTRLDTELKHLGLTQARWLTLAFLAKIQPVSQKELAEIIGIEGPTLVRLLDSLEAQGLLERRACGEDRRVKYVHLCAAAEPIIAEITRISMDLRHEVMADIPPEDLAVAHRVMETILVALEGRGDE